MDFGGVGIGKDRLESHTKLADVGCIITFGTDANTGDGLDIFQVKQAFPLCSNSILSSNRVKQTSLAPASSAFCNSS